MIRSAWLSARMTQIKGQAESIEGEIRVVVLVLRDPRTPWQCKVVAAGAVAYNLSPVTLIPDWIPVIGLLDNLLVLGLGVWLVKKLAPSEVLQECRGRTATHMTTPKPAKPARARVAIAAALALKAALAVVVTGALVAWLRHA